MTDNYLEIHTVPRDLYYHEVKYVRKLEADNALMRVALERIAKSELYDMYTLHPDGCAREAQQVLKKIGEQAA